MFGKNKKKEKEKEVEMDEEEVEETDSEAGQLTGKREPYITRLREENQLLRKKLELAEPRQEPERRVRASGSGGSGDLDFASDLAMLADEPDDKRRMILAYGIIAKQNGEYNRVKQELAGLKKQFGRGDD